MKTEIVCSTYSLGKHWLEVLTVFHSLTAGRTNYVNAIRELRQWRQDRLKGPRDSAGMPGQSALFLVEQGEIRLYFEYIDPKKKPKLMARAWIEGEYFTDPDLPA